MVKVKMPEILVSLPRWIPNKKRDMKDKIIAETSLLIWEHEIQRWMYEILRKLLIGKMS
jgi:hypothetical protein